MSSKASKIIVALLPGRRSLRALSSMILRPMAGKVWCTSKSSKCDCFGTILLQQKAQCGNIPLPVPQFIDERTGRLLRRNLKGLLERTIRQDDTQAFIQHQERFAYRGTRLLSANAWASRAIRSLRAGRSVQFEAPFSNHLNRRAPRHPTLLSASCIAVPPKGDLV